MAFGMNVHLKQLFSSLLTFQTRWRPAKNSSKCTHLLAHTQLSLTRCARARRRWSRNNSMRRDDITVLVIRFDWEERDNAAGSDGAQSEGMSELRRTVSTDTGRFDDNITAIDVSVDDNLSVPSHQISADATAQQAEAVALANSESQDGESVGTSATSGAEHQSKADELSAAVPVDTDQRSEAAESETDSLRAV